MATEVSARHHAGYDDNNSRSGNVIVKQELNECMVQELWVTFSCRSGGDTDTL